MGVSVVRGRPPGRSVEAVPSSSQVICSRVPSGKPSSGTTGLDCNQPPLGVAEGVERVLEDPAYRNNAAELRSEIEAMRIARRLQLH